MAEKLGLKDIVDERGRRGKLFKKTEGVASAKAQDQSSDSFPER